MFQLELGRLPEPISQWWNGRICGAVGVDLLQLLRFDVTDMSARLAAGRRGGGAADASVAGVGDVDDVADRLQV